ncbi:MAG: efflux RND transporter permease subunit, partial [Desulforhopalus sp.]
MNFATWSLRNPIPAIMFFALMTLAGLHSFRQLPVQDLPDVDLPVVDAVLSLPGAAPSQLETEVARKVEDSLASISGIKHINTSISDGQVAIKATFLLSKNLSDALLETKDAIDRVRSELPSDLEPPVISADRVGGDPLMTYAVSSGGRDEADLSWFVEDIIGKKILAVPGAVKFERIGGTRREIKIEIDPVKLASVNAAVVDISRALKEVQMEASGGRSKLGGQEQMIRTIATFKQAEELHALPIPIAGGRIVRLDQVATIHDTHEERSQMALLDGEAVVGFRFYRAKGFDEVQIAKNAKEVIVQLEQDYPDLEVTLINNTVELTINQYEGSMQMLYEGAILAVLVVWLFLRDWRATLIAATALPLSIIPTYALMDWLGYSLNTLTLLAQAVVVGILVDDAIVEIENIARHKKMGKSVFRAVSDAVNEIALAVMATTLTIVVVFIPTSLMEGVGGLFFRQFGWTVVISVLMSLLVARLLTPVMAYYFLKEDHKQESKPDGILMTAYLRTVRWCLGHKKTTLTCTMAFMVLTFALASHLPTGFLPSSDEGYTTVGIELPPGSTFSQSERTAEEVRHILSDVEGIEHVFTTIGIAEEGSGNAGEARKSSITLVFSPQDGRLDQKDIEHAVQQKLQLIPGARFSLESSNNTLSIILASENGDVLIAAAQNFEKDLRTLNYLSNIRSTASLQRPEINVRPSLERAADLGVKTSDIATTLRVMTVGDFDPALARLNLDNRQIYIRTYISEADLTDTSFISNLRIPTLHGTTALANIADISIGNGPSQVDRYDRLRYVTVNADLGGAPLGTALADVKSLPSVIEMPSSVRLIEGGDAELMNELFSGFGIAILTGILCVFCVLVLLFKDFFQPISILSALPLSFGGSIIALLITKSEMSLVALIGIVMLMGIVAKNSILLVDYTIMNMNDSGMSRMEALIDACHKRAQPIIMTTIAMIAGMMPIVLGFGGDASFRQPMAVAVVGGLITSTALSL